MKRTLISAAAAAALASSTLGFAQQDEWVQQVRTQIVTAGKRIEQSGYSLMQRIQTGSLNDGAEQTLTVSLEIGREYQMLGVCDNDCTDVDLTLYDPTGKQVAQDVEEDDYPVVAVEPGRSGNYRVKVTMAACSEAPCRFGVGVFGR